MLEKWMLVRIVSWPKPRLCCIPSLWQSSWKGILQVSTMHKRFYIEWKKSQSTKSKPELQKAKSAAAWMPFPDFGNI